MATGTCCCMWFPLTCTNSLSSLGSIKTFSLCVSKVLLQAKWIFSVTRDDFITRWLALALTKQREAGDNYCLQVGFWLSIYLTSCCWISSCNFLFQSFQTFEGEAQCTAVNWGFINTHTHTLVFHLMKWVTFGMTGWDFSRLFAFSLPPFVLLLLLFACFTYWIIEYHHFAQYNLVKRSHRLSKLHNRNTYENK